MKTIILILAFATSAFALTPKERELVNGLDKINKDNKAEIATDKATIAKQTADYLILWNTADDQAKKLDEAKKLAGDQEFELELQQKKVHDQQSALDKTEKERDQFKADATKYKHQAHVKSVVIDVTLVGLSIAVTVLVMMFAGQIIAFIVKIFPAAAPFGALLEIGIAVGSFAISFGFLKGILAVVESRL